MEKVDLSVLITARNEMFLKRTVEDVLGKIRGKTEIIVVLDGAWAEPALVDDPRVTIIYHNESVGQRAAINEAARVSQAKFIMKLDAHCSMDEGFDVKLMKDCEFNWVVIPRLYNLHAFDWVCQKCGERKYQGPTPEHCYKPDCDGKVEREMIWKPRLKKRSDFMRFDNELHFQYWGDFEKRPEAKLSIADTMSNLGACFFMHRDYYWELDGLDEKHGSWGQMGTEISCKTWLYGGRQVVNKNTWYSHMFRTQGGDFGFPYPVKGNDQEHARRHSRDIWRRNKWPKAKHNLAWMIEKFWPVPGWNEEDLKKLGGSSPSDKPISSPHENGLKKGIIYYTDNQLNLKIAHLCKKNIKSIGLPIVSASLKPMTDMGKNIHVKMERGYLAYFTQILTALEASEADIIYFCEHDVLYHPSHFEFTPPRKDRYYYNFNFWRVRTDDGLAIHYDTYQANLLCGYRETLVEYYRKVLEKIKERKLFLTTFLLSNGGIETESDFNKFIRRIGFEPGTHNREERVDDLKAERFDSDFPCIDIRHGKNLTASRWNKNQFRNQRSCQNWKETEDIPGWGKPLDFLPRI
jgi:glycosyltransferase involved in cell wall biosynthesis